MSYAVFKKYRHEILNDIVQYLALDDNKEKSESDLLKNLIHAKQYSQAIKFLALGFNMRDLIWWAYLCLSADNSKNESQLAQTIFTCVHQWVHVPSEMLRQQAKHYADEIGLFEALGWLVTAVFWSGGSIALPNHSNVIPTQFMGQEAAANAMIITANQSKNPESTYLDFIKRGFHIVMGGSGQIV